MKIIGILMILLGITVTISESWPLIKLGGLISLDPLLILLLAVPVITSMTIGISIIKKLQEKYIHIMFFIMYIFTTFSLGVKTIIFFIPLHIIYTLMRRRKV